MLTSHRITDMHWIQKQSLDPIPHCSVVTIPFSKASGVEKVCVCVLAFDCLVLDLSYDARGRTICVYTSTSHDVIT